MSYKVMKDGKEILNYTPVCSEDFCEFCGDCIACFGMDECQIDSDGIHLLILEES